jgi:hypothetical protein
MTFVQLVRRDLGEGVGVGLSTLVRGLLARVQWPVWVLPHAEAMAPMLVDDLATGLAPLRGRPAAEIEATVRTALDEILVVGVPPKLRPWMRNAVVPEVVARLTAEA